MVDDFRGRGGSPWGSPPGGGSGNGSGRRGPTPPNIDELIKNLQDKINKFLPGGSSGCLLYTSPSPRDVEESRMPSSA